MKSDLVRAMTTAQTLSELLDAMDDDAYEELDGEYSSLPHWGPVTPEVEEQIRGGCPEGDIVSWDTTSPRVKDHRYLRREWWPANKPENEFRIFGYAEAREEGIISN